MQLDISEEALKVMKAHAEEAYPNECCGFFYGVEDGKRMIEEARRVTNSKEGDQRRRFEVSPRDYMQAERYAEENGKTLLGVYHSHPDHPARPSEHDLKQAVPYFSYIILSVQKGKVADITSWQLDESKAFAEEEIVNQINQ
jgi:proteasome lid subunit RPN8/RPN11